MTHSSKDAVGGHVKGYHKPNRFSKRFNRREARREHSDVIATALREFFTEPSIEDEIDLDDFYDDMIDHDYGWFDEPEPYEPDYFADFDDEPYYYGYFDDY